MSSPTALARGRASAPASAPATTRSRRNRHRPNLLLVTSHDRANTRRVRRRGPSRVGLVALAGVFALAFGLAVFQTVLVQGQARLDDLGAQVAEQQTRQQRLRADVAELEAPDRVLAVAESMGLRPSDHTTFLTAAGSGAETRPDRSANPDSFALEASP